MSRVSRKVQSLVRRSFTRHLSGTLTFQGSNGTAWFAGPVSRAPSIAEYFCGDGVGPGVRGRVWNGRIPQQVAQVAGTGGLPIVTLPNPGSQVSEVLHRAIAVPSLVRIHVDLPADLDKLRDQLKTSTTREDLRRIRKAGFTYRVTTDPGAIREFHARHVAPLVTSQYPEDGRIPSAEKMVADLDRGGELVCADLDGVWVAGIFNIDHDSRYALGRFGIRDADESVRQQRVTSALIVRSLERAVELGHDRSTMGRSLPFLGKGQLWFKTKWGGVISRISGGTKMHMFMDLRTDAIRQMLSRSPVIHFQGDALVASAWLEPGEEPLQNLVRASDKFPGISTWYVLGEPETMKVATELLTANDNLVAIAVHSAGDGPVWLGEVLSGSAISPDPSGASEPGRALS